MTTVLIIEDNEKNLKLFKLILESNGFGTSTARDGKEGVELALRLHPDIILMDIQMPVMSGVEAIKLIKGNEVTKNTPVIATTAYAMKGDRELFLSFGFNGYISKPIRIKEFLETIDSVVNKSNGEKKIELD
jgi:two-component system cell cycle response regulator DivK